MCIRGCPVPIYQDPYEINELREIYRELKPKRVMEIGSLFGGSLWYWMEDAPGSTIVSVDTGVQRLDYRFEEIEFARKFLWPVWSRTHDVRLVELRSDSKARDTIEAVKNEGPYDFIFIDGGHDFETCLADYDHYWPMLRGGGVMAFHDTAHRGYQVCVVWEQVKAEHKQTREILRASNPEGIWGIGVVWKEGEK